MQTTKILEAYCIGHEFGDSTDQITENMLMNALQFGCKMNLNQNSNYSAQLAIQVYLHILCDVYTFC